MAKRRQQQPRQIPTQFDTWAEREAAAAGDQYIADLDGKGPLAHWVIRRGGKKGEIVERCPTVTKSEVEARVALLNRGTPTRADNQSWGKLTKGRGRPGKGVKAADRAELSVTEWAERLMSDPETSATLREYASQNRSITIKEIESKDCNILVG